MPNRTDIKRILIIGSGPIVIGQACEFDYSGTQACKALRQEGYEVVLVNSNPATIMTDPETADKTYIEPITISSVTKIIEKERPDALLANMGGQTGLNCAVALAEAGVLAKYHVEVIGCDIDSIKVGEDRELFAAAMADLGLEVARQPIPEELIVPAPGQAAIAVHVRQSDELLLQLLRSIHDTVTAEEVGLERRLLQALGGGCALPLGCVCHIRGEEAELRVFFASEDGQQHYSDRRVLPRSEAEGYVLELAEQLKKDFAL